MREMKKIFAGILMTVLLTGCSSQEILSEVPQTIVLPEEQIDSLPMQEEDPTSAETENTESFSLLEEGGSRFAYESLEAPEQIWYLEIEQALGEMEGTVKLSTDPLEQGLDEQDIDKIFQCVMIDHPEIFYATGYTYTKYSRGEKTVGIDFAGSYELNAPDNQNICSVFLEGASVCQGYAKATQYLLNHLGVMCTLVQGTVDTGEAHAWNLVRVDGDYYYVDTTWGDASYRMEDGSEQEGLSEINYDYLCVTTEDILRTHRIEGVVAMPECTAMEANYYVREGNYFTEYNREQLQRIFDAAKEMGRTDITLKCADETCYREICRVLIDEQEIFSYIPDSNSTISYAQNGKQLSLTFWVTNE